MVNLISDPKAVGQVVKEVNFYDRYAAILFESGDALLFEADTDYDDVISIDVLLMLNDFESLRLGLITQEELDREREKEKEKEEFRERIMRWNMYLGLKVKLSGKSLDCTISEDLSEEEIEDRLEEIRDIIAFKKLDREFSGKKQSDILDINYKY